MPLSYPDRVRARVAAVEFESPWFAARNRIVLDLVERLGSPRRMLEVGAGNGMVALHLQRSGIVVTALEPSETAAATMRDRGVEDVRCEMLADAAFATNSIEAVGLFDVIEHLEHPQELLREVHRILIPGGSCLVTVPALPWLWSDIDEYSGHFRRYTRSSLTRELERAGFSLVVSEYRFATAVLPLFLARAVPYRLGARRDESSAHAAVIDQLRGGGRVGAHLAEWAFRVEHRLGRLTSFPFGSSVAAGFVKRQEGR